MYSVKKYLQHQGGTNCCSDYYYYSWGTVQGQCSQQQERGRCNTSVLQQNSQLFPNPFFRGRSRRGRSRRGFHHGNAQTIPSPYLIEIFKFRPLSLDKKIAACARWQGGKVASIGILISCCLKVVLLRRSGSRRTSMMIQTDDIKHKNKQTTTNTNRQHHQTSNYDVLYSAWTLPIPILHELVVVVRQLLPHRDPHNLLDGGEEKKERDSGWWHHRQTARRLLFLPWPTKRQVAPHNNKDCKIHCKIQPARTQTHTVFPPDLGRRTAAITTTENITSNNKSNHDKLVLSSSSSLFLFSLVFFLLQQYTCCQILLDRQPRRRQHHGGGYFNDNNYCFLDARRSHHTDSQGHRHIGPITTPPLARVYLDLCHSGCLPRSFYCYYYCQYSYRHRSPFQSPIASWRRSQNGHSWLQTQVVQH